MTLRVLFLSVAAVTAWSSATRASAGLHYYVDPLNGVDSPGAGGQASPWRTTSYAASRIALLPPASQAGLVLNLRANALYPPLVLPANLSGSAALPMVVQPYDGDRVVFDGGEPRFRAPGAWEPVPGQVDEWRTKEPLTTPPGERVVWGQMMETRFRLVTYFDLQDLRAANQSYRGETGNRVGLSDPRPAPGPVVGDEAHKIPYTYLGPGVFYQFENAEQTLGRVHLRLSSTRIQAPGIEDFPGGGDPNQLELSIAREHSVTGRIGAQHLVLRNLTFQNGGRTTLVVEGSARGVTFDHCEVYGAQYGMITDPAASELEFRHCTFDGGLAPWTTRSDVKNEYHYLGPPDCRRDPQNGHCINEGGAKTHDILVIHRASRSSYVHCTFRRGHDGIQLSGEDVDVRDSLFEDLNDEALQLGAEVPFNFATNVRIHGNVIRQVLSVLSFAVVPSGGPVYFYRNVVDQRIPTRGERILPPDAPAPWVWRYGSDFKAAPSLALHCYQNTFVSSHAVDKGSYTSHLFYQDPLVGPAYLNNLHLVLNLDWPLSRVPSAATGSVSDGNVWHRYHLDPEPLFRTPLWMNGAKGYFTFEQLWADFPAWESHGQYADPQLANFTEEYFDQAESFPNTDYRPLAGSVAEAAGVVLPQAYPDDFAAAGAPDVGARPVDAPVMAVGVDAATRFPAQGVPVALIQRYEVGIVPDQGPSAASDETVLDLDGDGFALASVDASPSHDPDGTIVHYEWRIGDLTLRRTTLPTALLELPEGEHQLRLVVTDDTGQVDSDAVRVRVVPPRPGENRLACPGFEEGTCDWKLAKAVLTTAVSEVRSGRRALRLDHAGARFSQRVSVSPGRYLVSGWIETHLSAGAGATLKATLLDAGGGLVDTVVVAQEVGTSPYVYHAVTLDVPETVAFIELTGLRVGAGGGRALFDDLRVRDRNVLRNGRFEERAPNGHPRKAPGWEFGRGGAIVEDPQGAHSGRYALAMAPDNGYHLVRQTIVHVPGQGYRASGWIRTEGLGTAPTYAIRLMSDTGQTLGLRTIATVASEGAYMRVSGLLAAADIPAATATLRVELQLAQTAAGSAFLDDLLIEPVP